MSKTLVRQRHDSCTHDKDKRIHDYDTGEEVCSECGTVLGLPLDTTPEWRAYDETQRAKRVRAEPTNYYKSFDKGLGSYIGEDRRDNLRKAISPGMNYRLQRLRREQKRTKPLFL